MLKRINNHHIEEAIRQTRRKWEDIRDTGESYKECGFCELSDKYLDGGCCLGLCPIDNTNSNDEINCCTEYNAHEYKTLTEEENRQNAEHLLARIDKFNVREIVKTINKALKEYHEEKENG